MLEWAKSSMLSTDPPLANPKDLTVPVCVPGADEAIALIRKHHRAWLKAQKQSYNPGGPTEQRRTTGSR